MTLTEKRCTECGVVKPDVAFYGRRRNGHLSKHSACSDCSIARRDRWRQENRDEYLAQVAAYNARNAEKRRAYAAQWAKDHPDRVRKIRREWTDRNRPKVRERSRVRQSAKRSDGTKPGLNVIRELIELQHGKCTVCRTDVRRTSHLDHIMPLALGGSNERVNLQLLCPRCNLTKNAKHPIEFMQSRGFLL